MEPTAPTTASLARSGPRVDRMLVGALLAAVGIGWLLDLSGVQVPWHLLPAATLLVAGLALLATLIGGRGRAGLITIGVVAAVCAVAVGVGVDRYAGPVGDRVVAPTVSQWPVEERISAGTVTVDLTSHPIPETGRMTVDVGAGRIDLLLPKGAAVGIQASVTTGTVTVDGATAGNGIDVRWSQPRPTPSGVLLELHVGLGDIEVSHE